MVTMPVSKVRKLEHETPSKSYSETGRYGLPFSEEYAGEFHKLLRPRSKVSVNQLVTMKRTDGQAQSLNRLMTQPILKSLEGARVVRPKRGGAKEADLVEKALYLPGYAGGMTIPFRKFIAQVLLAINDGFAPFEIVPRVPASGDLAGKWVFKKLAYRPASSISFLVDETDDFAGFNQRIVHNNEYLDVVIKREYAIYYAAQEEEAPFYGRSYFEAAYKHYDLKEKLYYLMHLAAQRAAVGTKIGKHPTSISVQDKQMFNKAMADLRAAGYATLPDKYSVEALREISSWDFLSAINHHESQMSKSILAQFNDDQQGSGGDASLIDFGKQSDKNFVTMIKSIMKDIEDLINNELVTRLVDWNFGSGKYPTWHFGEMTDEQEAEITDTFNKLATAGQSYLGTKEFMRELEKKRAKSLGLDIDYDAIEKAEKEQEQAALEMQQMQMEQATQLNITPGLPLPDGFQLSRTGEALALARTVKTQQGADYFGVPLGAIISPDQEGGAMQQPALPGGVAPQGQVEMPEPKAEYSHPDGNGEVLLDFGDGTVALKDPSGKIGKRQKFDIVQFEKLGWKITKQQAGGDGVAPEEAREQQTGETAAEAEAAQNPDKKK